MPIQSSVLSFVAPKFSEFSGRRRALTIICNVLRKRGRNFVVGSLSASVVWKDMADECSNLNKELGNNR